MLSQRTVINVVEGGVPRAIKRLLLTLLDDDVLRKRIRVPICGV
jgi:hypothetical protein